MKVLHLVVVAVFAQNTTEPNAPTTPQPEPSPTPQPKTTTLEPTPKPSTDINVLYNAKGDACIMMQFNAVLHTADANYTIRTNETTVDNTKSSCVGAGDSKAGALVMSASGLSLDFTLSYNVSMTNVTKWKIDSINAVTDGGTRYSTSDLKAEWIFGGIAYSCITGFTSNLTVEEEQNATASISMSGMWLEIAIDEFPIQNSTHFSKAVSCAADIEESLLVPIIVATALAGLVLSICVAYIIGRRRTYSGYNPM